MLSLGVCSQRQAGGSERDLGPVCFLHETRRMAYWRRSGGRRARLLSWLLGPGAFARAGRGLWRGPVRYPGWPPGELLPEFLLVVECFRRLLRPVVGLLCFHKITVGCREKARSWLVNSLISQFRSGVYGERVLSRVCNSYLNYFIFKVLCKSLCCIFFPLRQESAK